MASKDLTPPTDSLYEKVAALIAIARQQVRAKVNQVMVMTYWQIGQLIVEDEQAGEARAEYGKAVLQSLAAQLTERFGKGFDQAICGACGSFIWHFQFVTQCATI